MPHRLLVAVALFCACAVSPAAQTVFPTGTTIYGPERRGAASRCSRR